MISPSGLPITFYAFYAFEGEGVAGLTVTIDVYEGTSAVVTAGSATEVGGGLYRYTLAGGSTGDAECYAAVFKTAEDDVDAKHVPALWVVGQNLADGLTAPAGSAGGLATVDSATAAAADPAAKLAHWFKAEGLAAFAHGADLTAWVDSVTGTVEATPVGTAPTVDVTTDGLPHANFAGGDRRLRTGAVLTDAYDRAFTLFLVYAPTPGAFEVAVSSHTSEGGFWAGRVGSAIKSKPDSFGRPAGLADVEEAPYTGLTTLFGSDVDHASRGHRADPGKVVLAVVYDGVYVRTRVNGVQSARRMQGAMGLAGHALTLGGFHSSSLPLTGRLYEVAIAPVALAPAEVRAFEARLAAKHRVTPKRAVIADGNSLTYGSTAGDPDGSDLGSVGSYLYQLLGLLADGTAGTNKGVPGQGTSAMLMDQEVEVLESIGGMARDVTVVAWELPNEVSLLLGGGATLADALAMSKERFARYCRRAREAGARVLAIDVLPQTVAVAGASWDADVRQPLNAWLDAYWPTFADGLVVTRGTAGLADASDLTYFSDGIHLTAAGQLLVAGLVRDALQAMPTQVMPALSTAAFSAAATNAGTAAAQAAAANGKLPSDTAAKLARLDAAVSTRATPEDVEGGGGGSAGTGDTPVNHNTGGTDNLRFTTAGGAGIDGAEVIAYTTEEWDADPKTAEPRGRAFTGSDGRWANVMMLDAGEYTFVFNKSGYDTVTVEATVS